MLANYFLTAIRHLVRNPFYTAISVLGLALGLTVAILAGVFVRHHYSYDSSLPDHERILVATQTVTLPGQGRPVVSYPTDANIAQALKLDFPQIETVARVSGAQVRTLTARNVKATEETFAYADPSIFTILRLPVVAGDLGSALASPDSLVLTRSIARKYFGRDNVVGETLQIESSDPAATQTLRVTAVIEDLKDPHNLYITALASSLSPDSPQARAVRDGPGSPASGVLTYIKLRPGSDVQRLRADLPNFATRRLPPSPETGAQVTLGLSTLTSLHVHSGRVSETGLILPMIDPALIVTIAAIALLILVVATLNFISLMTARSIRRALEVGVRKALGASRRQLVVQFLCEAFLYVILAMGFALACVKLLLPLLNAVTFSTMRFDVLHDPAAFAGLVILCGLLTFGAGFYPALVLSSYRSAIVLKGSPSAAGGSLLVREGLVLVQFAVLIGLLVFVGVVVRQNAHTLARTQAVGGDRVILAYNPGVCGQAFRERLLGLPGVNSVACSAGSEISGTGIPTQALTREARSVSLDAAPVDFGLLEMHGVKPVAGRLLGRERGEDAQLLNPNPLGAPAIVINQSAARALGYATPAAAVGQMLKWRRPAASGEPTGQSALSSSQIVGVTPDFALLNREAIRPLVYYVDPRLFNQLTVKVGDGASGGVLQGADRVWRDTGHLQPLTRFLLVERAQQMFRDLRVFSLVFTVCVGFTIFTGGLGLFALAAYTAERRRKEMGVRKALGASWLDVGQLFLWQFTRLVLLASLVAWPLSAWGARRWLSGFADHVEPPIWLFAASTCAAILVAWVAVGSQAVRVARTSPSSALRYG
jgi:putative ABC transport system permease protein